VPAWLGWAGLALLTLSGAVEASAAEPAAAPRTTGDAVDAEMLRDLDLLTSPDYTRDREVARRMGLLERLRLLENQVSGDAAAPGRAPSGPARATAPAGGSR
jgi:hypothetical protein